jgi:hypothetical protein
MWGLFGVLKEIHNVWVEHQGTTPRHFLEQSLVNYHRPVVINGFMVAMFAESAAVVLTAVGVDKHWAPRVNVRARLLQFSSSQVSLRRAKIAALSRCPATCGPPIHQTKAGRLSLKCVRHAVVMSRWETDSFVAFSHPCWKACIKRKLTSRQRRISWHSYGLAGKHLRVAFGRNWT